jgi:hypothetical protein
MMYGASLCVPAGARQQTNNLDTLATRASAPALPTRQFLELRYRLEDRIGARGTCSAGGETTDPGFGICSRTAPEIRTRI